LREVGSRYKEDRTGDVELRLCHVQVFDHSREFRGTDVGSVKEREGEENAVKRARQSVKDDLRKRAKSDANSRHPWNQLLVQLPQQCLFPPRKLLGTHIPQLLLDRLVILVIGQWRWVVVCRRAIGRDEDRGRWRRVDF
jgi:hypothetical protein